MKIMLICVLICVVMLIAFSLSNQYGEKLDFYTNLKQMLEQYKINVSFKQEKIKEFLENTKAKRQFKLFIEEYKNFLTTNELKLNKIDVLDLDEKQQLETIVRSLGQYDVKNEMGQISSFIAQIEDKLTKAKEEKNKFCPLIIKLSLLFAVGLGILLI